MNNRLKQLLVFLSFISILFACAENDSNEISEELTQADQYDSNEGLSTDVFNLQQTNQCDEITSIPHQGVANAKTCILIKGYGSDSTELLQYGLHVSGQFGRTLYLEGEFNIHKTLSVKTGTKVLGVKDQVLPQIKSATDMIFCFLYKKAQKILSCNISILSKIKL